MKPGTLDWETILRGKDWLHFTGTAPAMGEGPREELLRGLKLAKQLGVTVSVDYNYRRKLWDRKTARQTMETLMEYVDVGIGNEEDCEAVFGIKADGTDFEAGNVNEASYSIVADKMVKQYGLKMQAITLRESISANRNGWSAILHDGTHCYTSQSYMVDLVDRIGGGDSFAGGLIYGLCSGMEKQEALNFAVAASCIKQTIPGDFNLALKEDVLALMHGKRFRPGAALTERVHMEQTKRCDVLVIGAGVAGMRAAVAAQNSGAHVILAVKGTVGTSGASCYTVTEASGFGVADGRRCAEDSPDVHYADVMRAGHGMCDPDVVRTLVEEAIGTVQELEAFGVEFEKENGDYLVSQGCFGSLPRNYNLRGHGTKIIRALKNALNQNTQILENVMITELLVQNRRCVGAVALTPEGGVTVIRAGAVILASGGAGRLFRYSLNPKEMTGDSYALGYLAGAELMNMEFMQVGMGVLAPGTSILNSWIWSLHPEVTDRTGASVFPAVFPDGVTCEAAMDAKSVHYPFSSESPSKNIELAIQRTIAEGTRLGARWCPTRRAEGAALRPAKGAAAV